VSVGARESRSVGANAAADFEDTLASPVLEFRIAEDVRLNEIFARFDFVEVFPRPHGLGRVPDITGPVVPIFSGSLNRQLAECRHQVSASRHPQWI
jgi:hypothetical protein